MPEQRKWVCLGGPLAGALVEVAGPLELGGCVTLAELGRGRLSFNDRGRYQAVHGSLQGTRLPPRQFLQWVEGGPDARSDGGLSETIRDRPTGMRHFLFEDAGR